MAEIRAFLEQEWRWQLADNPEYASQCGQHQHDHRLQDLSPAAFEQRREHNVAVLADALQLQERSAASADAQDALNLELFIADVRSELRSFELGTHLYPINSIGYGGVHNNWLEALDWLGGSANGLHCVP